ncbi:MAG: hypothetical protein WC455_23930 [Dehalococcoidia bacterium]
MPKAAVAIDNWKLSIFKRHLSDAGFQFEQHPGVTKGTLTLTVVTASINDLEKVVRAANAEAQREKLQ